MRGHCDDAAPSLRSAGAGGTPVALRHAALRVAKPRCGVTAATRTTGPPSGEAPAVPCAPTLCGAPPTTAWRAVRTRGHPSRAAASTTPRPPWRRPRNAVGPRHLDALLPPCRLCLSRRARAWQPPRAWPSPRRPAAPMVVSLFVDRLNRALRQRVVAGGRRGNPRCPSADGRPPQRTGCHADDHVVLVPASVRHPLRAPHATNGRINSALRSFHSNIRRPSRAIRCIR